MTGHIEDHQRLAQLAMFEAHAPLVHSLDECKWNIRVVAVSIERSMWTVEKIEFSLSVFGEICTQPQPA